MLDKQTFVLAISGGVDSVVMLHKLLARKHPDITYVIAHYDHGIRADSHEDATLVQKLALMNNLQFETEQGKLGPKASEALAREKRYDFLRRMKDKHQADKIVTAHHQDDVLETMVINLIRGTGPRGLMPMTHSPDIVRPLLSKTKAELVQYAKDNSLKWHEDSTNDDEDYLRNYVRKNIMPKFKGHEQQLVDMRRRLEDIYYEIDLLLKLDQPKTNVLHRPGFIRHSFAMQREMMRSWLIRLGVEELDRKLIERCVIAVKTLPIGKKIDIGNTHWLSSQPQNVQIIKKD
jgi:tRNA(Ile)-lysidine synthetase-like protein